MLTFFSQQRNSLSRHALERVPRTSAKDKEVFSFCYFDARKTQRIAVFKLCLITRTSFFPSKILEREEKRASFGVRSRHFSHAIACSTFS